MTKTENYYFWLGEDGEATPVDEVTFKRKQQEYRKKREDFLNVR